MLGSSAKAWALAHAAVVFIFMAVGCAAHENRNCTALDAQAGIDAYLRRDFAACARFYAQAAEHATGRARADYLYSSGSCDLRHGDRQTAVESLRSALRAHPSYYVDVTDDSAVRENLGSDPAFTALVQSFKPAYDTYLATVNSELRDMYEADQRDRKGGPDKIDWSFVGPRDVARRKRLDELMASGQLRSADDYYFAAMILQHGEDEASYDKAYRLATRAVELDSSFVKARWLAAAAKDRYHMSRGEPQLYGTQYKRIDGNWSLWPVDFHVADTERAEWSVPSLGASRRQLEKMNAKPK